MTCLVSWISVDSKGPSAMYIGADSRISWKGTGNRWDICQKVFSCKNSPDIFGYSGDSLFATQVLSHAVDMADSGLLFNNSNDPYVKFYILSNYVKDCFTLHPKYPVFPEFKILYCTRNDHVQRYFDKFHCFSLSWNKKTNWQETFHPTPTKSQPIATSGTGGGQFNMLYDKNIRSLNGISRGVFFPHPNQI